MQKNNIDFINPTKVLSVFSQKEVIENDLRHYTELGINKFTEQLKCIILYNFVEIITKLSHFNCKFLIKFMILLKIFCYKF